MTKGSKGKTAIIIRAALLVAVVAALTVAILGFCGIFRKADEVAEAGKTYEASAPDDDNAVSPPAELPERDGDKRQDDGASSPSDEAPSGSDDTVDPNDESKDTQDTGGENDEELVSVLPAQPEAPTEPMKEEPSASDEPESKGDDTPSVSTPTESEPPANRDEDVESLPEQSELPEEAKNPVEEGKHELPEEQEDPVEPIDPKPEEPEDPVEPIDPKPEEPEDPVEPIDPKPEEQEDPVEPIDPKPEEPEDPAEEGKREEPEEPEDPVEPEEPEKDFFTEGLEFASVEGGYLVSGYTGTDGEVVKPAEYEGMPVIGVADGAFMKSADSETQITKVVLGKNIRSIGVNAFAARAELVEVVFDDALEIICESAFMGTGLTEFTAPESLREVQKNAFFNAPITEVYLPARLKGYVGRNAFGVRGAAEIYYV